MTKRLIVYGTLASGRTKNLFNFI